MALVFWIKSCSASTTINRPDTKLNTEEKDKSFIAVSYPCIYPFSALPSPLAPGPGMTLCPCVRPTTLNTDIYNKPYLFDWPGLCQPRWPNYSLHINRGEGCLHQGEIKRQSNRNVGSLSLNIRWLNSTGNITVLILVYVYF